ncbi:MAG: tetratricopeptide repeat protein [Bryobacterales bacterium]|nr:tetratricopeptide repeat protein [Bryobacterales bacterium]
MGSGATMSASVHDLERTLLELPPDATIDRIRLLNRLAWTLRDEGTPQRMRAVAVEAEALARHHASDRELGSALVALGFAEYLLGENDALAARAVEAREVTARTADYWSQAGACVLHGLLHWNLGNYDAALREGFDALHLFEQLDARVDAAWCCTAIGGVYQNLGDLDEAFRFQKQASALFAESGHRLGAARTQIGLAAVLIAQGKLADARALVEEALEAFRALRNTSGEARALSDLGEIHRLEGHLEPAFAVAQESLNLRRQAGLRLAEVTSLLNLGRLHFEASRIREAREDLEAALDLARQLGAKPKIYQAHELLANLHEESGDFAAALDHWKDYQRIREQVFNEERTASFRNLKLGFELENTKRESEIHRLRSAELKEKNEQLARLVEELQLTQAQLVQSEKMSALGSLVAALAHEINSPLGTMQSAADLTLRCAARLDALTESAGSIADLKGNPALKSTMDALRRNADLASGATARIGKLLGSLKSFARLDQASFARIDLHRSIDDTLAVLEPEFRQGVRVVRRYGEIPQVYCYPAELNQVFFHLLRNAGQAIEGEGEITVETSSDAAVISLRFTDTGRGIPEEQLAGLFTPSFRRSGPRVKASISLFSSLNIVKKHRGDLRVESEVGRYTAFTVLLPRELEHGLDLAP